MDQPNNDMPSGQTMVFFNILAIEHNLFIIDMMPWQLFNQYVMMHVMNCTKMDTLCSSYSSISIDEHIRIELVVLHMSCNISPSAGFLKQQRV